MTVSNLMIVMRDIANQLDVVISLLHYVDDVCTVARKILADWRCTALPLASVGYVVTLVDKLPLAPSSHE